jgi:hypothetical protein
LVAFLDGDDGAWGDVDEREQVVVRGGGRAETRDRDGC